ncbi:MAG: 30S ribosome-binding factor RbfA [Clostridia bacterium]|nr:30S ribosome-binding factor RbfA [Clostridia bacterium]
MANYRRGRINDEMKKELAVILREIKDPRVKDAFVSITGVDVTPDLKFAKVYYSAMRGEPKEVYLGLKSSAGFIRRQVAQRLNLRATPEFTFVEDNSIAYGAHISKILSTIEITPEEEEDGNA